MGRCAVLPVRAGAQPAAHLRGAPGGIDGVQRGPAGGALLQAETAEDRTIAILPFPGARLRTHTWTPDFLAVGGARAIVLEVDGPHHAARHRHVSDRDRDLQWYRCGVHVARIAAEDTEDAALLRARLVEEIRRNLYPGGGPSRT